MQLVIEHITEHFPNRPQTAAPGGWSAPWLSALAEATFACYCSRFEAPGHRLAVRAHCSGLVCWSS